MRMIGLATLLLAVLAAVGHADNNDGEFRIAREVLMESDSCLVVKLKIDAPPTDKVRMTRVVLRYGTELKMDISNGISTRGNGRRQAEILFVAQFAVGNGKHPTMLMLSTQQSSPGPQPGACSSQAHVVDKRKLGDVLSIDVKAGSYPLGKQIRIGTLGVDGIYLSIEP